MPFPTPPTDISQPLFDALNPLAALLNGGASARAEMTGIDDSDGYGLDVTNATGAHLRAGNNILLVTNGGVNVTGLTTSGALQVGTDLTVLGNTTLGNAGTDTVTVAATATFNAAATFNGNTTLGDAAGDTLVVNATETHNAPATFNANVQLGNSTTADTTTVTSIMTVGGDFSVSTNGFAVTAATNKTRVNLAAVIGSFDLSVGPNGITSTGNIASSASLIGGATALVGGENLRVVGSSRLEGGVTVTTGSVTVSTGSLAVTAGGISAGASSAFTGGVSVVSGGLTVIAGGVLSNAVSGTPAAGVLYTDNTPKAWGNVDGVSGSTPATSRSFNVSSVVDLGGSGHRVIVQRAFANSTWAPIVTPLYTPGGTAATTVAVMATIEDSDSCLLYCHRVSDGAHLDPAGYAFAFFGAQ